jgi:NACalpha-BTF3-like transcription factor
MSTQNTTLELFAFTKPTSQFPAGMTQTKVADNGSVSVTLSLEKRKVLAERLGLKGKDNTTALNRAILQLTDQVKAAATGEFMKLAASEDWTGGRFTMRRAKNGTQRATLSLVTVKRQNNVSQDDVVKALASMSAEQVSAIMNQAAKLQNKPIELEAVKPDEKPVFKPTDEQLAQWKADGLTDEEIASEIQLGQEILDEQTVNA